MISLNLATLFTTNAAFILFVCLSLGYLLGRVRIRSFELGSGGGVLIVAILLGHLGVTIDPTVGAVGFVLFIYSVGWQAGPRFFSVFRTDGPKYVLLATIVAVIAFVAARWLSALAGLDLTTTAGVLAGALTSTPTLIGAESAVESGAAGFASPEARDAAINAVSVGYAITYVFGTVGLMFVVRLVPQYLGLDLPKAAADFASLRGYKSDSEASQIANRPIIRAYVITNPEYAGQRVADLAKRIRKNEVITRIKTGDDLVTEGILDHVFKVGDRFALLATPQRHAELRKAFNVTTDVLDDDLVDTETAVEEVTVTQSDFAGRSLAELSLFSRFNTFLSSVRRSQLELPRDPSTVILKGDVLTVSGERSMLDRLIDAAGYAERKIVNTDLITFSFGIIVGLAIGEIKINVGTVEIGIGAAGGLLLSGLVVGFLRSIHPTFGHVPPAARFLLMEIGLLFFLTGVGLRAGSGIVEALASAGIWIVLIGVAVTLLPLIGGYIVGHYFLRMNPAVLLGALTGAMTSTPALGIVQDIAKSSVPALGYAGTYAFANILLTAAGTLMLVL